MKKKCPICLLLPATYFCANDIKFEKLRLLQQKKMAKKKEPINLMPAKSKVFLSKTLVEHTT